MGERKFCAFVWVKLCHVSMVNNVYKFQMCYVQSIFICQAKTRDHKQDNVYNC